MELGFIGSIVIGILAGFIAKPVTEGQKFGIVINLIAGVVGAVLSGLLFYSLNIDLSGTIGMLIMSVIGAVVFLWILSLLGRYNRKIGF